MAWRHGNMKAFQFVSNIGVATGATTLVAAPGAGRALRVQSLNLVITTSAAQTVDIEDTSGTVELIKIPASMAAGSTVFIDPGPEGVALTANEALRYAPASAGVGLTISGWGWVQENVT